MNKAGKGSLERKLKAEVRLGRPLAQFPFPELSCSRWEIGVFTLIHLGTLVVFVALLSTMPWVAGLILLFGLGIFIGWVRNLAKRSVRGGKRLQVYPSGVAIRCRDGANSLLPWNLIEVRQRRQGRGGGFLLAREGGEVVCEVPARLSWAVEAEAMILQTSTRHLIRRFLPELAQGVAVTFGPFTLETKGVSFGAQFLPWTRLEGWTQNQGWLSLLRCDQRQPWAVVPLEQVPNPIAFQYLCDQCLAGEIQPFHATSTRPEAMLCG
jgi:hypothetical protein